MSSRAYGFSGLQLYASDIDAILRRCHSDPSVFAGPESDLVHDRSWDEEGELALLHEPLTVSAPQRRGSSYASNARPTAKSKWPMLLSVAAVLVVGASTFALMHVLEQRREVAPSIAGLQKSEVQPPVGRGLVLTPPQIRYCIAQGIRLGAAAEAIATAGPDAAAELDRLFADYDQRCAEYRFQAGAFDTARRDVEARRRNLERAGRALLLTLGGADADASKDSALAGAGAEDGNSAPDTGLRMVLGEAPRVEDQPDREVRGMAERVRVYSPEPRRLIKDLQWRLFKLRYYAGPIDGVDSQATQDALRGFFSVYPEASGATDEKEIFRAVDTIYQRAR